MYSLWRECPFYTCQLLSHFVFLFSLLYNTIFIASTGPWTRAETTFSNDYFRVLLEEKWEAKKVHEGKAWTGPRQFESKDGQLMMLPAELAFLHDQKFRPYVELYAKDEKVFFQDFAAAFSKLLELGVKF